MAPHAGRAALLGLAAVAFAQEPMIGCWMYGYKFTPYSLGDPVPLVTSTLDCQKLCQQNTQCKYFSYFRVTQHCYLSETREKIQADKHSIAGPARCIPRPMCQPNYRLSETFPRAPMDAGKQLSAQNIGPPKLQCWPRDHKGHPEECPGYPVTTLQSTAQGWAGKCRGLTKVELLAGETCEENCRRNITCPSFQVPENGKECWQGVGHHCETGEGASWMGQTVSKRFQHGSVKVLKNLNDPKKIWVPFLDNVFKGTAFQHDQESIKACRNICLSVLHCEVWLYSNSLFTPGCFIENPAKYNISWPSNRLQFMDSNLLSAGMASTVVAGEYWMRICTPRATPAPLPPVVVVPPAPRPHHTLISAARPTPEPVNAGTPVWVWIIAALGSLLLVGVIAFFVLNRTASDGKDLKPRSRSARGAFAESPPRQGNEQMQGLMQQPGDGAPPPGPAQWPSPDAGVPPPPPYGQVPPAGQGYAPMPPQQMPYGGYQSNR